MSVTERYTLSYLPDHSVSTVYCLAPEAPVGDAPLVMMWPGFGMGARYYRSLAREFAGRGYNVATGGAARPGYELHESHAGQPVGLS